MGQGQGPREELVLLRVLAGTQRRALWEDSTVQLCRYPSNDVEQASYDSRFGPNSRCGGQW